MVTGTCALLLIRPVIMVLISVAAAQ